jgi:hypothetical protein
LRSSLPFTDRAGKLIELLGLRRAEPAFASGDQRNQNGGRERARGCQGSQGRECDLFLDWQALHGGLLAESYRPAAMFGYAGCRGVARPAGVISLVKGGACMPRAGSPLPLRLLSSRANPRDLGPTVALRFLACGYLRLE